MSRRRNSIPEGYGSAARGRIAAGLDSVNRGMAERLKYIPDWPTPAELIEREMTPLVREVSDTINRAPFTHQDSIRVVDDIYAKWGTTLVKVDMRRNPPGYPLGLQLYDMRMTTDAAQVMLGQHLHIQIETAHAMTEQAHLVRELGRQVLRSSNGPAHFAGTWPRLARVIIDRDYDGAADLKDFFQRPVRPGRIDANWQAAIEQCDIWIAQWLAMPMGPDENRQRELNVVMQGWEPREEVKKYITRLAEIPIWV